MGKNGDEQAFRVTEKFSGDIVIYDTDKERVVTCSFCKYDCKHERYIEEYLDYMIDNPNYMGVIRWAWNYDDGRCPYNFRIRYFAIWDWLSNGLMRTNHRTLEETQTMMEAINYQLDRMKMTELALLTLWRLPDELRGLGITERWELATHVGIQNGMWNYEWS